MHFLRPLNLTGPTAYVWSGAVGNTTDLTTIDPGRNSSNSPGRRAIGIYVGAAGNLLVEAYTTDGYSGTVGNMYYAGVPAGTVIHGCFSKVLSSGLVKDSATSATTPVAKTSTAKDLVIVWEV